MLIQEDGKGLAEKSNDNIDSLTENQSDKNLIATLEDLGYLPNGFQGGWLFNLLEHKNPKIRFLAAKNIAKLNQAKSLEPLWNAFQKETNTTKDSEK